MTIFNFLFPFTVFDCAWLAPAALLLDLAIGDPALPWPPPVCLAGKAINFLEKSARIFSDWPRAEKGKILAEKLAGFLCVAVCALIAWLASIILC